MLDSIERSVKFNPISETEKLFKTARSKPKKHDTSDNEDSGFFKFLRHKKEEEKITTPPDMEIKRNSLQFQLENLLDSLKSSNLPEHQELAVKVQEMLKALKSVDDIEQTIRYQELIQKYRVRSFDATQEENVRKKTAENLLTNIKRTSSTTSDAEKEKSLSEINDLTNNIFDLKISELNNINYTLTSVIGKNKPAVKVSEETKGGKEPIVG